MAITPTLYNFHSPYLYQHSSLTLQCQWHYIWYTTSIHIQPFRSALNSTTKPGAQLLTKPTPNLPLSFIADAVSTYIYNTKRPPFGPSESSTSTRESNSSFMDTDDSRNELKLRVRVYLFILYLFIFSLSILFMFSRAHPLVFHSIFLIPSQCLPIYVFACAYNRAHSVSPERSITFFFLSFFMSSVGKTQLDVSHGSSLYHTYIRTYVLGRTKRIYVCSKNACVFYVKKTQMPLRV